MVEQLIENGANVNIGSKFGFPALLEAILSGNFIKETVIFFFYKNDRNAPF